MYHKGLSDQELNLCCTHPAAHVLRLIPCVHAAQEEPETDYAPEFLRSLFLGFRHSLCACACLCRLILERHMLSLLLFHFLNCQSPPPILSNNKQECGIRNVTLHS